MTKYQTADAVVSAHKSASITPSDVTMFEVTRALYVGGAGDLTVTMADGNSQLFTAVPVGVFPIQVTAVKATGTTATGIVALY